MSIPCPPIRQRRAPGAGTVRIAFCWALLVFCLPVLVPRSAAASPGFEPGSCRGEEIFPADTILCVKLSGVDRLLSDRESLDLYRLWKEDEVRDFFRDTMEVLPDVLGVSASAPFPIQEIWPLLEGDVTVAMGRRLVVTGQNLMPSMAIAVDMGADREAFLSRLAALLELIGGVRGVPSETIAHRGFELTVIGSVDERKTICFTTVENLFVATVNKHHLIEILDARLDGKPNLATNPAFVRCLAKAGGAQARGVAFANFDPFIETLGPYCPKEIIDAIALLGVEKIDALCLSSAIEGGGSRDSLFIDCPGEKTGLLAALAPHPLSGECFGRAPADTVLFMGLSFDPGRLLKEIEKIVQQVVPELHGQFRADLAAIREETGFDLETEILASLGDEISLVVSMPKTGVMTMIPDMILTVDLGDEDAFLALREKVFAKIRRDVEVVETTFAERTLHHVKLPQRQIPLAPTFVVDEGRLLVGGTPLAMKRYLRWLDSETPGLTATPGFGRSMIGVPEAASFVEYIDLQRIAGFAYENGAPFLATMLPRSGLPLDAGKLPLSETITNHVSSAVVFGSIDEEGISLSGRTPFGGAVLLSLGAGIADYVIENDFVAGLLMRQGAAHAGSPAATLPDQALGQAIAQKNSGDFAAAESGFTRWIAGHPEHPHLIKALIARGECRMELRNFEGACADFRTVAEKDATCRGLAYSNLARAAAHTGDADASIGALEQAILAGYRIFDLPGEMARFAEEPRLSLFIDMVTGSANLIRDGEYETADQLFTEWIYANPYHDLGAWALKNRGECRIKLDRRRDAIADFTDAAARYRAYGPQAYYNVACCHAILGDGEKAIECLAKAIDTGFKDFDLMDYDPDLDALRSDPRFKALRWTW